MTDVVWCIPTCGIEKRSWYKLLASRVINFSRLSGGGGGARELDPILFLFIGTDFLGTMKNKEKWFGHTRFLEGRERVQDA